MALTTSHRLYLACHIYRFANSLKKHMRSASVSHQFRDEETNWLSEQLMSLSNDNICRLLSSSVLSKKKKKMHCQIANNWYMTEFALPVNFCSESSLILQSKMNSLTAYIFSMSSIWFWSPSIVSGEKSKGFDWIYEGQWTIPEMSVSGIN